MTGRVDAEGAQVTTAEASHDVDREIERYGVLDTAPGRDLEALVALAAQVFGVTTAAINVITGTHQHQIATAGFEASVCAREDSMCAAVVTEPGAVVVADARLDDRFAQNPFVTGAIGLVRFYASAPLVSPDGVVLGRLCVFDEEPREATPQQHEALAVLAARIMDVLELRLRSRQVEQAVVELTRTRDELKRSNEALVHFAAQVSHDLRNPLMVVSANAEMLRLEPAVTGDDELVAMVDEIADATRRMSRLIRDVLDQAREGGRPRGGSADLGAVFDQALLDLRPLVDRTGAAVTVERLPTVPGDEQLLYTVALNLVGNALKFAKPGVAPRVHVSAQARTTAWRVRVRDEGVGIPAQHVDTVFLPYVRAHGGTGSSTAEGHGIGLSTVRRVVEAHGGVVGLESLEGRGTTVWFELPDDHGTGDGVDAEASLS